MHDSPVLPEEDVAWETRRFGSVLASSFFGAPVFFSEHKIGVVLKIQISLVKRMGFECEFNLKILHLAGLIGNEGSFIPNIPASKG